MTSKPIGGYAGKLLRVDLTHETFVEEQLDEKTLRKYVGGAGLGAMYLYAETRDEKKRSFGCRYICIRADNFPIGQSCLTKAMYLSNISTKNH